MIDGPGLRFLDECKLGIDELQWAKETAASGERRLRLQFIERPGLLCRFNNDGTKGAAWKCAQDGSGSGELTVSADDYGAEIAPNPDPAQLLAVDVYGYVVEYDGQPTTGGIGAPTGDPIKDASEARIVVPDDSTWYTLVMRRDRTLYEPGTLGLTTGSAVVVGTGTEFTKYNGYTTDGYDRGTRIYVQAADSTTGNESTYQVDTITDDTHCTLTSPVLGTTETGVRFQVAGQFAAAIPTDPAIHSRLRAVFELVARTREPSAGDFIIADVMLNTGVSNNVQIIDRREANIFMPRSLRQQRQKLGVTARMSFAGGAPYTAASLERPNAYAPGAPGATWVRAAPADDGGLVVVIEQPGSAIRTQLLTGETWSAGGNVDVAGTAVGPAIVQVPRASARTHITTYVKAGICYRRLSTDNGASWGPEVLLWDPTAVDPLDLVAYPSMLLTLKGRIIVAAGYWDDSVDAGAGQWQIRWVYSDDYGDTWETNSNEGFTWIANFTGPGTYRDNEKPSLWQAGNGLIACAWVEDAARVRVFHSHSDNDLSSNPEAVVSLRVGTAVGSADTTYDPAVFCDAQGNTITFQAEHVAGVPVLRIVTTRWTDVASDERILLTIQNGGGVTADPVSCAVVQKPGSSTLYLLFSDTLPAAPAIVAVKCDLSYGPSEWRSWES